MFAWGDERGVSVQIGAVLLFGFLVVFLSLYQAQVVPAENGQVEYAHGQQVQNDLLDVRNSLVRTAAGGSGLPAAVTLGTGYPGRVFFVNPPPATGRLFTDEPGDGTITIGNATALDGETADYWDGGRVNFSTTALHYRADYHEMDDRTRLHVEHGAYYSTHGGRTVVNVTDDLLVDGRTVTLPTLNGSYAESGVRAAGVDPRPLSTGYRRVQVRGADGSPVTVTLPTNRSAAFWERRVHSDAAAVASVPEGVRLTLDGNETWTLRLARVGVGSGTVDPAPHYVTVSDGADDSVRAGETTTLTFEVRDAFNNPYPDGATLNVSLAGDPGSLSAPGGTEKGTLTNLTTDGNGLVRVVYHAPESDDAGGESVTVRASIDPDPAGEGFAGKSKEDAAVSLTVEDDSGGDGGEAGSTGVSWFGVSPSAYDVYATDCSSLPCRATTTLPVLAGLQPPSVATPVGFGSNDTGVAALDPTLAAADGNGILATTLQYRGPGSADLVAAADGSRDTYYVRPVHLEEFQDDLGVFSTFGQTEDGDDLDTSNRRSESDPSAHIDAGDPGGIEASYDLTGADAAVVEFWATDGGAEADEGETLAVQYRTAASRGWQTATVLEPGSGAHRERVVATDLPAGGGAFDLRFRQSSADHSSDDWFVDSVSVTALGTGLAGGEGGSGGPGNSPPVAAFAVQPDVVAPGETVRFDATDASDPDGSVAAYDWTFGDGDTASKVNLTHQYADSGVYQVTLTVTDDDGATDTLTRPVAVLAGGLTYGDGDGGGAVRTTDRGHRVAFDVHNSGSEPVVVTAAGVETRGDLNGYKWVEPESDDGDDPAVRVGGASYDHALRADGDLVALATSETLRPGDAAAVSVGEFRSNRGEDDSRADVDSVRRVDSRAAADLVVTLERSDGSTVSWYFDVDLDRDGDDD